MIQGGTANTGTNIADNNMHFLPAPIETPVAFVRVDTEANENCRQPIDHPIPTTSKAGKPQGKPLHHFGKPSPGSLPPLVGLEDVSDDDIESESESKEREDDDEYADDEEETDDDCHRLRIVESEGEATPCIDRETESQLPIPRENLFGPTEQQTPDVNAPPADKLLNPDVNVDPAEWKSVDDHEWNILMEMMEEDYPQIPQDPRIRS